MPSGPAIFLVHVSSTLIPFTSESKEAIADIPEIENEIKLALRICARKVQHHIHKKVKREKTREKFELITRILPEIAKKSSKMLNKPLPSLDSVITKIMDVVWIEDLIEYVKISKKEFGKPIQMKILENPSKQEHEGTITKSKIIVINYKRTSQKLNLYVIIPEDAIVGAVNPKPSKINSNFIKWNLDSIPSSGKIDIDFELAGLEEGDFDENDIYIENINPTYVIGADKWEGE
jgi:DNA topoisomerase-6 subunit B